MVGAFVGNRVSQVPLVQRLKLQSLFTKHFLPGTHAWQPPVPPQSMSVSASLRMPSMQLAGVGEKVGAGVGVPVVGVAVGAEVGYLVGAGVGIGVGAGVGAAVGSLVGAKVG